MSNESLPLQNPRGPSQWRLYRREVLVGLMLVAAVGLNLWAPLWLKPTETNLAITSAGYLSLFLIWAPVYFWTMREHRRPHAALVQGAALLVFSCCVCTISAPALKSAFGLPSLFVTFDCRQIEQPEDQVRYACVRHDPEAGTDTYLTLEGYDWLPVYWRVE